MPGHDSFSHHQAEPDERLRLVDSAGRAIPLTGWEVDVTLPAQVLMRAPAEWAGFGRSFRLVVKEAGDQIASYPLFLPGRMTRDGSRERTIPLMPAELGHPDTLPHELILDTLASVSAPETLRRQLLAPGLGPANWSAAHRGLLVTPLTAAQRDAIRSFADAVVELRTRTRHHRGWFLVALLLLRAASWVRQFGNWMARQGWPS
jgi:hypothetical protein